MLPPESSSPDPADADPTGRVLLGRFRIEKVLGRGGMGEVLLAHDTLLHRRVALKRLRPDGEHGSQDSDGRRSAILKEARRASQVSDRRIAAIHDVVELGDDVIIVMEYVDGVTLREQLREPVSLELFWNLSEQCVGALAAAHAQGIIHRDIKPENLMLTREHQIKILDFGIARRSDGASGAATPEATTTTIERFRGPAGTPAYMAPETHYSGRIDERTDIFSLGAVFYEMLAARHPFEGGAYENILDRIMNSAPAPASELNPAVPAALSNVVAKMLARDPSQRYASCDEVAAALAAARAGTFMPDARATPGAVEPVSERLLPRRSTRGVALALAAVAVVVAAPFAWRALSAPRVPKLRNLAILLPATPGASRDFAAFALGSVELLASRLQRHQDDPGFQMSTFQESADEKLGRVEDARKLLGANLALVPTLVQTANGLRARLELREPLRGRLVRARTVEVPLDEPLVFADTLYHTVLELLGLPARGASGSFSLGVRGAGTLRFLSQGIGRMRAAEAKDDLQPALDDFEMACRTEPDAATARVWRALVQLRLYGRSQDSLWLERAETSAREAVALDRGRSETHRALGQVLGFQKRYAESLVEYRRACEQDPTQDDAWYRYGRTWQRLGDADSEKAVYVAASKRRPGAWRPRWWLGSWEFRYGHVEAAMLDYAEMIRRAPDFEKGYAGLGGLLVLQGEYARAIDTLKLAVALRPTAVAFGNLGTAYFNSGKLTQAVDAYNQAFQFGTPDYVMWLNLGDAYFWLRDRPDQAREAYTQAVRLGHEARLTRSRQASSEDPRILADLASVYPKLGQSDSARVYLGQALATDSTNSDVQYGAALTQWQLGDRPRALSWLERAVAGGYPPIAWLRDSPVHREWREEARFRQLLTPTPATSPSPPSPGGGR